MAMSATEPVTAPHTTVAERRAGDRRRRPTSIFSRYAFFGGRRKGDRRGGSTANAYVDLYEPALAASLVAIAVLCALDAVFTLLYLQKGGEEANPLMAEVIEWGPQAFILVKCGVTNLGLGVLCMHKNFRWVRGVINGLLGAYVALFGYHLYLSWMLSARS
jgi:hypothetical protein